MSYVLLVILERLSSLRQKGSHGHGHTQQSWQTPYTGGGGRAGDHAPDAPPHTTQVDPKRGGRAESAPPPHQPATPIRKGGAATREGEELKPQVPVKQRHKRASELAQGRGGEDHAGISRGYPSQHKRAPYDKVCYNYNPAPGNYSSLPRTNSQGSDIDGTRGSKPYSSARYPSSTTTAVTVPLQKDVPGSAPEKRRLLLSRNASFHGTGDMITVAPLDRNPAMLSEETEDDSYLYRKSVGSISGRPQHPGFRRGSDDSEKSHSAAIYQNVVRRSSLDDTAEKSSFSGYQNATRRSSDEGGRSASGTAVVPPVPLVPPRRKHGVILEDPSSAPPANQDLDLESDSHHHHQGTFPRRIPSRTQSMNVHGDSRSARLKSLPREFEWQHLKEDKEKGCGLRRGMSYHGPGDMPRGGTVGGAHGRVSPTTDFQASITSTTREEDTDIVPDLVSPTSSLPKKQHRRTHSYDTSQSSVSSSSAQEMTDRGKRRASEHFPASREEEADLVEEPVASLGAVSNMQEEVRQ